MCTLLEDLIIERQCGDNLCWAAIASGISTFYHEPLKQCEVARQQLLATQSTAPNCCPKFPGDKCNKECDCDADLKDVLDLINHLDGSPVDGLPSNADLKTVMDKTKARLPICVRVEFVGGGGHFVAVRGFCDEDPANIQITVGDPAGMGDKSTMPLKEFKAAYLGSGTWSRTFFTK